MSDDVSVGEPVTPLPWYKSDRYKAGLRLYIPTVIFLIRITHLAKRLGIDFDDFGTDQIVDAILAIGCAATGTYFIIKRKIDGLNHRNLARPIEGPVAQIKRLTQ